MLPGLTSVGVGTDGSTPESWARAEGADVKQQREGERRKAMNGHTTNLVPLRLIRNRNPRTRRCRASATAPARESCAETRAYPRAYTT